MSRLAAHPDTLLTVDLGRIARNLARLRGLLPSGMQVAGVVKADAYGHGLVPVARLLKQEGAEALAVANLTEGLILRRAGLAGPILLMLGISPGQARSAASFGLTPFVGDMEVPRALAAASAELGRPVTCQLKVDTGMGRLGVAPQDALELLEALAALPGLEVSGLASHLATAGEPDHPHTHTQTQTFARLLAQARDQGHPLPQSSLAGSGGVLVPPPGAPGPPGMVRLGMALYGGLPSPQAGPPVILRTAMGLTTRLHTLRRVPAGTLVSYGATWQAPADTWLGALPVGYSDGYPRALSNQAQVLVGGRRVPVVGRVCMNLTMVDLGPNPPGVRAGDPVVLLGSQGEEEITVDQLAAWADTIPYEICCRLGAVHRRRYLD